MPLAIKVEGVSKSYPMHRNRPKTLREWFVRRVKGHHVSADILWALHDISFDVSMGETVGLIGHNGAGKSTMIRLLCGTALPTKGSIQRFGTVGGLLELGSGVHPMMSGRENIRTAGILNGLTKKEVTRLEEEMIEFAELEEFIDEPVRTYSSGMYLRLAFSSMIHLQPEIMIIDELLAVGDLSFRTKCFERLDEFRKNGRTLIIASHEMDPIKKMCDEVIVLEKGAIVLKSSAEHAVEYYENLLRLRTAQRLAALDHSTTGLPAQPDQGDRMGTHEALITSVEVISESGQKTETVKHGADLIVNLEITLLHPVSDFVISLAIFTEKDVQCFETLIPSVKNQFGGLNGRGRFQCRIRSIPLLAGRFYLNVGLYPPNWEFIYDYHWQMHSFQVTGEIPNITGIFSMKPEWSKEDDA